MGGTRKVVINRRYGGFGLSYKGVMRYAELKGIKLYPWISDFFRKIYGDRLEGKSFEEIEKMRIPIYYTIIPKEEYDKLPEWEKDEKHFLVSKIPRDDPILIQVVEELGEEANGIAAELKIVEIPDDVEWVIEEYDGKEWVAEKHRIWK